MTNLDSIFKSRDITLPTKVRLVKAMIFLVVMWSHIWMWELDCEESWAPKNWWFWIVVLEKTFESPLDCKAIQPVHSSFFFFFSSQSILKEMSPGCSLERLILKLKLQYFGHLMRSTDSLEKSLMLEMIAGREGDHRGRDGWMASPTQWTWVWASSRRW